MAKAVFDDYIKEILYQRRIWENKPVVRKLYQHRYEMVVRALSPLRPVIEVGSGSGNFKEYFPEGRIARTTVEARAVISTKIEIECIAYKPL